MCVDSAWLKWIKITGTYLPIRCAARANSHGSTQVLSGYRLTFFLRVTATNQAPKICGPTTAPQPEIVPPPGKAEHVIFIWLGGGMAQIDTFDPKRRGSSQDRVAGTDYDVINTAVPGVQVCQHLKRTADRMDRVTAVRTVHHEMIDEHAAAVYWVHVGRPVNGTIQYPITGFSSSPPTRRWQSVSTQPM